MNATTNVLLCQLLADLQAEDIPDPLAQSFTLAVRWLDLCRLAGEVPLAKVTALLGETWSSAAAD